MRIRQVCGILVLVVCSVPLDLAGQCDLRDPDELSSPRVAYDGRLGHSVAVSGDVAVVGAFRDDDLGDRSGSAYIFRFDGLNWLLEQKLLPSDGAEDDRFGWSVAIDGDWIVVGSPTDTDSLPHQGSAYLFHYTCGSWVEGAKLTASDPATNDELGRAVDIRGEQIVVGAPRANTPLLDSGAAYVFRFDGADWPEVAKITSSEPGEYDRFGWSVAVDGKWIVVGVPKDDDACPSDPGCDSGSAWLFRDTPAGWSEVLKLAPDDVLADDRFGYAVAVSGDLVLVGAWRHDTEVGLNAGAAYLFGRQDLTWTQQAILTGSEVGGGLGLSVALEDRRAVAGAEGVDSSRGATYVYHVDSTTCFIRGDANIDGATDGSDAVYILAALFVPGSEQPPCLDAADVNDDGMFDVSDPVTVLTALFIPGSPPPPAPTSCGYDPTADTLLCESFPTCQY